ncbi:ABC transporter ATP-binding protein/permease [Streptomyces coelicoflavus]|uniref:ATP-binding cassette domain-containing protein n=1 Tax=Streptomyces coelicoflavus TaxID=285562 RepID=UPI00210E9478|nr:ABC transporter ATP-binding protein [Streptomyces coelicoflavus]MCQ4201135.1 ABC transporter ATP-binding protein/permease [Streptomyces coelicoflavus]
MRQAPGNRNAADGSAPGRALEALVLLCSVGAALAAVAQPFVLGRTLDLLLRDGDAGRWLPLSAGLLVGELLLDSATALFTGRCTATWTQSVRSSALHGLLRAVPEHARPYPPGDVGTRLTLNAADAGGAPAARAALAASLITPLGALAALTFVDLWVALCVLTGLPALALVLRSFARDTGATVAAYQRTQSLIASRLLETLEGTATIGAAGTADRERARVLAPLTELAAQGRHMWVLHGRALGRSAVLVPALTLTATAVGGLRLAAGELSVGDLLAVGRYAQLTAGVGGAATLLGAIVRARQARHRTLELERMPAQAYGTRSLPPDGPGELELRGVRVVRDGRRVLRVDRLRVPGGSTVAVVGRGGSGKSVLAAVAGRLIDPDEGHVLLDGVRLDRLTREALRGEVTYAFERPVLGEGTVAEAVAAGARRPTGEQVRRAARAAGADGFVRRLPLGYDTPLPQAPLSGGEHQRLGLARAFAHAGRLLVMDDATSSLDTATEHRVNLALSHSVRPGTRLVVAHRPSVADRADLVLWLEEGSVRAVGTHRDLWHTADYRAVFGAGADAGTGGTGAETPGVKTVRRPEPEEARP